MLCRSVPRESVKLHAMVLSGHWALWDPFLIGGDSAGGIVRITNAPNWFLQVFWLNLVLKRGIESQFCPTSWGFVVERGSGLRVIPPALIPSVSKPKDNASGRGVDILHSPIFVRPLKARASGDRRRSRAPTWRTSQCHMDECPIQGSLRPSPPSPEKEFELSPPSQ